MEILPKLIILAGLGVASITDIRTRTIPLWLMPACASLNILSSFLINKEETNLKARLVFLLVYFLIFLGFAIASKGGGGDAIMLGCVGCSLNTVNEAFAFMWLYCLVIILAFILSLLYNKLKKEKKIDTKNYPMAPLAAIAYLLFIII